MHEQLEHLLELSRIDSELRDLMDEYESLPGRIAEIEAESEAIGARIADREEDLENIWKQRRRLERELEDLQAKLADLESKRLVIKTNEEYAALTHEIESAKNDIAKTEDEILGRLEAWEEAKREFESSSADAAEAKRGLENEVSELRAQLARLDEAVLIKKDERLRVSKRIAPATLERYERILASKGDTALARIDNGACSGCYMKLPPQTVIEVKRADRFIECESCGRILYWMSEAESG